MSVRDDQQSRWRWREVSPRRVAGTLVQWLGLFGVALVLWNFIDGNWNPEVDPPMLAAAAVMVVVGSALLWRVKPASWP